MSIELIVHPRTENVSHVALVGRLDVMAMKQVDVRFNGETAACDRPAIVDLSRLEFITSLGIGMLFGCARSLNLKGHKLIILGSTGFVDTTLRVVGMHDVIPFADTWEEAMRLARNSGS
jgi:anti-anti-sigma factor